MKINILLLAGLGLLLSGCMTMQYKPGEYEIGEGKIASFDVRGEVNVKNRQSNNMQRNLFDSGAAKVEGNLQSISQSLAWQLHKEINKNGIVRGDGTPKTIEVSVIEFYGKPAAFHIKTSMSAEVHLGNGKKVYADVSQGSPAGYERAMNGTIALGVIDILKNPEVLQYLSSD